MARYLSEIFTERLEQYGFRGDPYFWGYLEAYFAKIEFPYSETWLTDDIYRLFAEVSGEQLSADVAPYVEQFAHGGMSSGRLNGEFWVNRAIPLLIERYQEVVGKMR